MVVPVAHHCTNLPNYCVQETPGAIQHVKHQRVIWFCKIPLKQSGLVIDITDALQKRGSPNSILKLLLYETRRASSSLRVYLCQVSSILCQPISSQCWAKAWDQGQTGPLSTRSVQLGSPLFFGQPGRRHSGNFGPHLIGHTADMFASIKKYCRNYRMKTRTHA